MNHYTYRVFWSDEDQEFVALCAEFPSLSYLADTPANAVSALQQLVDETVADMQNNNEPIPQPLSERQYSGKFNIRIPPALHRALAIEAAENQISMNRLISNKLSMA